MSWLFAPGSQNIGAAVSIFIPSNEYSGLISFRIDWFDLPALQGALQSLLQPPSLKASALSAQAPLWSNSHIHT